MLHVQVDAQEGFPSPFRAVLIPGLHEISQPGSEPVSVISTQSGEVLCVPSRTVHPVDSPEASRYREEWATKADRNPREVYVPKALRDEGPKKDIR